MHAHAQVMESKDEAVKDLLYEEATILSCDNTCPPSSDTAATHPLIASSPLPPPPPTRAGDGDQR